MNGSTSTQSDQTRAASSEPQKDLQSLILSSHFTNSNVWSFDALLDTVLVLYDECANSSLRREKCIADFICKYKLDLIFLTLKT
ncbi:hypothetical protein GJ496_011324 [Pomphorhynchus laevis]|nr:hypothetical protein GJ496_011324 [Pomphorhynchus laevis]